MAATAKVGTAYAEYRFDLRGFRQDKAEILKTLKTIQQSGGNLPPLKLPAPQTAPLKQYGDEAARAANQTLVLARAEASLLQAQGNLPGAFERLSSALRGVDQSSLAAIRAKTQLASVNTRLAKSMQQTTSSSSGLRASLGSTVQGLTGISLGAAGAIAALGTAAGAMDQAAQRAQIIQQALGTLSPESLQRVDAAAATLATRFQLDLTKQVDAARVVMKAFETDAVGAYDIIAAGAARGINVSDDFLDTLKEYAPQFAALGFTAEQTLSLLDIGLKNGARDTDVVGDAFKELNIRLNELGTDDKLAPLNAGLAETVRQFQAGQISGDVAFASIIAGLDAMGDTAERQEAGVALFGTKFEDLGATAVLSLGQVNENLIVTDGAIANLNNRVTTLGEIGPRAFAAIGSALTPLNNFLIGAANNVLQFTSAGEQVDALQARILAGASSFDAYRESTAAANMELMAIGQTFAPLSEAQFVYAQALMEGGAATADALAQAQTYGQELAILDDGTSQVTETSTALADAQALLAQAQAQTAATTAVTTGETLTLAEAEREAALAAQEDAAQQLLLAAQSDETAAAKDRLKAQAQAAAQALLASGADGAASAARLANSSSLVDQLTAAYYRLAAAQQSAAQQAEGLRNQRAGERNIDVAGIASGDKEALAAEERRLRRAAQLEQLNSQALRFQQEQARRAGGSSGGGGSGGSGGSSGGAGSSGGRGKSEAQLAAERAAKEQERLAKQQETERARQLERLEQLQRSHEEKILDIQEEFARKQRDQEQKNNLSKLQSKASFYDALTKAETGGDISAEQAQQLSAAYEAAFAESQRLAQEGKASLAAEYLALRQSQIEEELAYEQALAAAKAKGDQAEVQRLQAIEQLKRAAREEELKQLLEAGDKNINDRDQALAEADEDYIARQAEILGVTEEVAAARLAGEERSAEAVQAGNDLLRDRVALLRDVADASVGRNLPVAPTVSSAPSATATAEPTPANASPDGNVMSVADAATHLALADLQATLARLTAQVEQLASPISDTARNTGDTASAVQSLSRSPMN